MLSSVVYGSDAKPFDCYLCYKVCICLEWKGFNYIARIREVPHGEWELQVVGVGDENKASKTDSSASFRRINPRLH